MSTLRGGGAPLRVLALDLNRMGEHGTLALAWAVDAGLLASAVAGGAALRLQRVCGERRGVVVPLAGWGAAFVRVHGGGELRRGRVGAWERACVPELSTVKASEAALDLSCGPRRHGGWRR